ncbi:hypothetical protein DPMN_092643 [Dreissena polymorpha]|uniref:Mab-21-like HhH/H2TH-like domain-containing protein n=1 Tax=Dreissena polymorpha TaxID=45954 RepID=A0A9D4L268_DREPO|nr:hypothetical protein DPMN_092643 [Dreissena polymorpha]
MLFTARANNTCSDYKTVITAGSKAESLVCLEESDTDRLFVLNNVLCVEAGVDLHTIPDDIDVYRMDTSANKGHCRMLLERYSFTSSTSTYNALCLDGKGNSLLSSKLFLDEEATRLKKKGYREERKGPSLTVLAENGHTMDRVFAVSCQCPGILQRWAQRSRYWPPPDVVQRVVSSESFLCPVGCKSSINEHLEWRICFNIGETELVHNLNGTQAKGYAILKMIVKEVLKPNNKEITSFVLKNIIFWPAESNSASMFQERNLIRWLHDALKTLRTVLSSKQLPYYIIPERNLMEACGLQDQQQRKWVADITDIMEEGPRMILRLPRIRQTIICYPEPLLWFSRRRMELEMLQLEYLNRDLQCIDENGECDDTDIILQAIYMRHIEIVRELIQRMFIEGSPVDDRDRDEILRRILM